MSHIRDSKCSCLLSCVTCISNTNICQQLSHINACNRKVITYDEGDKGEWDGCSEVGDTVFVYEGFCRFHSTFFRFEGSEKPHCNAIFVGGFFDGGCGRRVGCSFGLLVGFENVESGQDTGYTY